MTKSREIRQKILKIMDLALKISPPDKTREEGELSVFVEYVAHVNALQVRHYDYCMQYKPSYNVSIYLDNKNSSEKLDEIIKYLQELREEMNNVSEN